MTDRRDCGGGAPCCATVGGVERTDGALVRVVYRHDHRSVRAHDRLSADDAGPVGRRGGPGLTTVRRGAHLEQVAGTMVVPLGVAVPVERAGRRVVAGDPVLIEVATGGGGERCAPGQTAVRGTAGDDGITVHAARLEK